MQKTKLKVRLHQPDFLDFMEWRKKSLQDVCHHRFRRYPLIDNENFNRIYDVYVCCKCGLER
ncbi:MAG: hypothetical protein PHS79_03400 [Patescibacteria group bacterium]|nr:hypothetical protein [Patescibacteria group bacterium]